MTTQGLHCEAVPGSPGDPPSLSPSPQHSLSSVLCFPSLHSLLDAGVGGGAGWLTAGQPACPLCLLLEPWFCLGMEQIDVIQSQRRHALSGRFFGADTACGLTLVNET